MIRLTCLVIGGLLLFWGGCGGLYALGARPRAMGGAYIGISDDENAVWTNPAGMSQIDRSMSGATSQAVERDLFKSDSISHVGKILQSGGSRKVTLEDYLESDYEFRSEPEKVSNYSWGLGIQTLSRAPELNERFGNEYIKEDQTMVCLAFATRFPLAERLTRRPELYGGMSIEYLNHEWKNPSLPDSSSRRNTWDLNLSLFYRATDRFNFGARIDSLASEKQDTNPGNLRANPTTFNIGGAYTFGEKRDTIIALDFTNVFDTSRAPGPQMRIGLERQFLDNDFALRLGSYDGTLTIGFGIRFFDEFRVDYAYENFTDFREHYLTVKLPF